MKIRLRNTFCILSFVCLGTLLTAQQPAGGEAPRIGKVSGFIQDKETGEGLEYAIVSFFRGRDTLPAAGGISEAKGYFSVSEIPAGMYRMKISFIGYETFWKDSLLIHPGKKEYYFEKLSLVVAGANVKTVEISAEKQMIETGIDKRVYNVGKDITATGGTVADVLQNVPSVTIDMDRNIQLRGNSSVNILIDGKPSTLSGRGGLDQLPASLIEKVEVITNPSAKYDPDGVAGIINIVTRKDQRQGFNGSLGMTAATGKKYNLNFNMNYRTRRFNSYLNFSGLYNRYWSYNGYKVTNYSDSVSTLDQFTRGANYNLNGTLNGGADFYLSPLTTVGVFGLYSPKQTWGYSNLDYRFLNSEGNETSTQSRANDNNSDASNYEASMYVKRNFRKEGRSLNLDVTFSGSNATEGLDATQKYLTGIILPDYLQHTTTIRRNAFLTPQLNYVHPLKNGKKLEAGLKAILRDMDNDLQSLHWNDSLSAWQKDTGISNRFVYTDQVLSAYAVFTGAWKNLGYSAGLRAEQTFYQVQQVTLDSLFRNRYFNFFPSAHLKYKIGNASEAGISYSRRINRPNQENLNPFPEWRDPYNFMYGNPYLKPEYIHSIDLSFKTFLFKKVMFMPSVFYRYIQGSITRYRAVSESQVSVVTFRNLNDAQDIGGDLVLNSEIAKWWSMNASLNYFYRIVDASNIEAGLANNGFSGNFRALSTFRFWKNASALLIYNYQFPFVLPQGKGRPGHSLDIGLKKDLLHDRLSLTLRLSDVFNTRKFRLQAEGSTFTGAVVWKRESRIGLIGISYRFGKGKAAESPKRPREDQGVSPDGGAY